MLTAQERERASFSYAFSPSSEFAALDAKIGTPPWRISKTMLTAKFEIREADLELNKISSDIHLKEYKFGVSVILNLNDRWNLLLSPSVAIKNASHSLIAQSEALSFSGIALFLYKPSPGSEGWSFGFGSIYSKEINKNTFLPALSAKYTSTPYRLEIGFPTFGVFYSSSETWNLGFRGHFDFGTYALPSTSDLNVGNQKGIRIRYIEAGPILNARIANPIWLTASIGAVILGEAHLVSGRGSSRQMVFQRDDPLFFRVALSYR